MNDIEPLIQRFLDQELTPAERVQFVVRLGRDEALRRRVIELEQLVLAAQTLPRPPVPDGFVAGVMARTAAEQSAWGRFRDTLLAPREFRWTLAGLSAAAASLLVFAAASLLLLLPARDAAPPAASDAAGADTTVLVRLVVLQPGATTVEVAGDFNAWTPDRTPLEQITGGAWTVTLPLKPGRYEYQFVIDGQQWIADPLASEHSDDGFGSRNAVLDVRAIGAPM
jgi:hypothetical protein